MNYFLLAQKSLTPPRFDRKRPSPSVALFIHWPVFDKSSCFLRHNIHTQMAYTRTYIKYVIKYRKPRKEDKTIFFFIDTFSIMVAMSPSYFSFAPKINSVCRKRISADIRKKTVHIYLGSYCNLSTTSSTTSYITIIANVSNTIGKFRF